MANWSQCEEFPKRKPRKGETIRNRNTPTETSKTSKQVTPNLSFAAALSVASNKNSTPGTSAAPEETPSTNEKSNENDFGLKDAINELRRFFLDYSFLLEMGDFELFGDQALRYYCQHILGKRYMPGGAKAEFSNHSTPWVITQIQDRIPPRLVGNMIVEVFLSTSFD
ncbi:hypothetical protein TNCV_3983361 [Trichonephila clavipes]|nr:hypothetical protein TNCV_3983361 [Trichonephila clavipes]